MMGAFFLLIVAYVMGSFPMGLWIGQFFFNKDIRAGGSGNTGATNAYRILGPTAGILVFLADFLKGAAPVIIMKSVRMDPIYVNWLVVAAGLLAMIGHTFSVFLRFKGGKGVATAIGVITILSFKIMIILLAIWLVMLAVFRYVSLSSIVSALALIVFVLICHGENTPFIIFSFFVAILIIYKHRSNIKRLLSGKEPKVGS